MEVTLWHADGAWWLAVSDAGTADLPAPGYPALDSCGGRGLLLVEVMADIWKVLPRTTTGKTVVVGVGGRLGRAARPGLPPPTLAR